MKQTIITCDLCDADLASDETYHLQLGFYGLDWDLCLECTHAVRKAINKIARVK